MHVRSSSPPLPASGESEPWLTQPAATVIGGLCVIAAGILAFLVAYYNRRQTEEHWRTDNRQERFTTIAGQLADPAVAVRLAGVYAMEALIDDWLKSSSTEKRPVWLQSRAKSDEAQRGFRQAQACISVLCAYLRLGPPSILGEPLGEVSDSGAGDAEVRSSIFSTIATHVRTDGGAGEDWSRLDFNFADTTLNDVNFTESAFRGSVTFARARFCGRTVLNDVQFYSIADFSGSVFEGSLTVSRVIFDEQAGFSSSVFEGSVDIEHSEFRRGSTFRQCAFREESWFTDTHFGESNNFNEVVFESGAYFSRSHVLGNLTFLLACFDGSLHDFTELQIGPDASVNFSRPRSWNSMEFDWDDESVQQPRQVKPAADRWPPRLRTESRASKK